MTLCVFAGLAVAVLSVTQWWLHWRIGRAFRIFWTEIGAHQRG